MLSLSDAILQDNEPAVRAEIERSDDLNALDEYGFTPLIEAAIANNEAFAGLLLDAGAKVDKADMTGGTALQWAAENNNLALAELLLKHGADANTYTNYGQPALVKPLLRYQQQMKELFYQHGADLNFAQDYINAKLLGHRYSLIGKSYIVNAKGKFIEVDFEGFVLEFTLGVIQQSLVDFKNNFAAKHLRGFFDPLQEVIDVFTHGWQLLRYQQYQVSQQQYQEDINQLLNAQPLYLPVAYQGHAVGIVRYKDLLARCDRGEHSLGWHSVVIYQVGRPRLLNKKLLNHLLFDKQTKQTMNEGLDQYLELEPIAEMSIKGQQSGNCSWANAEAVMPALLFMKALKSGELHSVEEIEQSKQAILELFDDWCVWDKNRALHQCIQSFYQAGEARQASKASLLAAVLYRMCADGIPDDLERAGRILEILSDPRYDYVLKAYVRLYAQDKRTKAGQHLLDLIDLVGFV